MQGISTENSIAIAQKSLDALWKQQQVISDNIANVDTPGYKSKGVQFEQTLQQVLKGLSGDDEKLAKALETAEAEVYEVGNTTAREDDVDAENIELVRAQLQYQAVVAGLSGELSRMKQAISGS